MIPELQFVDAVDHYLDLWGRWMRTSDSGLGYPKRSAVVATGGGGYGTTWEDWGVEQDERAAVITDAAISSLPLLEQAAIHHVILAAVWRTREPVVEVFGRACDRLGPELRRRGLE